MGFVKGLRCRECGREYPAKLQAGCEDCFAPLEVDYHYDAIAKTLGVRAERGRRFAELTSLRVGGSIDWVISPATEEQAAAVVFEMEKSGVGWRALGSGSNVLADDGDHHYVVLSLSEMKGVVEIEGEMVSVSAGYSLPRLCIDVARRGLAGIEGLGEISLPRTGTSGTRHPKSGRICRGSTIRDWRAGSTGTLGAWPRSRRPAATSSPSAAG